MNNTFLDYVESDLKELENLMRKQTGAEYHADLRAAFEHLLSAGGKRIRPTIVFLAGGLVGADKERLTTLAGAIEVLHTATLVHDDLIDGSLLRRGIPTLNARWSPAATVLTGDFLFGRAAKLAAEVNDLPLMKMFAETLTIIVNGEISQMFLSKGVIDRNNYYQRIYAKTGSLFELSAYGASLIGTEDETVRMRFKQFGYELGIAFQIMDDVLDFNGEQMKIGKPVGSDLLNGLVTLPTIYYAESHPDDPEIKILSEGGWANREKMETLVETIQDSRAIEYSINEAREHILKGLEAISVYEGRIEHKHLKDLANYVVERTK
ncbi:MAG TPA: polyprenyl synthetase family protein [Anaerolineales bacterium]|nr:polyprenyl synthetase family protein [Anaerolineales bacterium]